MTTKIIACATDSYYLFQSEHPSLSVVCPSYYFIITNDNKNKKNIKNNSNDKNENN